MSVRITTYMDGPAPALDRLPEARAVCDGCGASGPWRDRHARAAAPARGTRPASLAVAVAAYQRVTAYPVKGKAHGIHLCARCVKERAS